MPPSNFPVDKFPFDKFPFDKVPLDRLPDAITDVFEPVFLSATINFEMDLFDFETGGLVCVDVESDPNCEFENTVWDFKFARNADLTPNAVLFQNQNEFSSVEIAFLNDTSLADAVATDLSSVVFTSALIDMSLGSVDTILLRTTDGNVFAIGNASETPETVSFDYFLFE